MSNFQRNTASKALQQIMLAESAEEWRPYNQRDAQILLPDGEWLTVEQQRIAEAAAEIRNGDVHPTLASEMVREFVETHEDDDKFDEEELEKMFRLAYDREPDDEDRENGLWSLICAVAQMDSGHTI